MSKKKDRASESVRNGISSKKEDHCESNSDSIDPRELSAISDIVNHLKQRSGPGDLKLGALAHCFDEASSNGANPVPLQYNPRQTVEDRRAADTITSALDDLELAADALQQIKTFISRQTKVFRKRVKTLRLRGGMLSLPDEIIVSILEFASYSDIDEREEFLVGEELEAALNLSYVCRRFRSLAIQTPSLWCRIPYTTNVELVSAMCERVRVPIIENILADALSDPLNETEFNSFLRTITPHAEKWARFELGHFLISEELSSEKLLRRLEVMACETHQLNTPSLSKLSIHYPRSILAKLRLPDAHFYSTWAMPNLTSFEMSCSVPVAFPYSKSLSYLRVYLEHENSILSPNQELSSLIGFLQSCLMLKTFSLSLSGFDEFPRLHVGSRVTLQSVEALRLSFSLCNAVLLQPFFDAIDFPNVSTMRIGVQHLFKPGPARDILPSLLRDGRKFENVERLELDFTGNAQLIYIPFASLSRVRHLTLILHMTSLQHSFPNEPILPYLQTLTFQSCLALNRAWVGQLLECLKSQGNIPRLTMDYCQWDDANRCGHGRSRSELGDESAEDEFTGSDNSDSTSDSSNLEDPDDDDMVDPWNFQYVTAEEVSKLIS